MKEARIRKDKGGRNDNPQTQRPKNPPDGMAGESLRSQLRTWLKEICPRQNIDDYCLIMADSAAPEVMKVRIFTHDYRYSIYATGRPDEPEKLNRALLSCDATRRKSLAGLTEHTYAHLVEGQFTRVTWELIKAAILRFELVKIVGKAKKERWQNMSTHFESNGNQYYEEWLQKGIKISEHRIYELVDEKEEGVAGDSESTDVAKK